MPCLPNSRRIVIRCWIAAGELTFGFAPIAAVQWSVTASRKRTLSTDRRRSKSRHGRIPAQVREADVPVSAHLGA
jgi:hypothetical protein